MQFTIPILWSTIRYHHIYMQNAKFMDILTPLTNILSAMQYWGSTFGECFVYISFVIRRITCLVVLIFIFSECVYLEYFTILYPIFVKYTCSIYFPRLHSSGIHTLIMPYQYHHSFQLIHQIIFYNFISLLIHELHLSI